MDVLLEVQLFLSEHVWHYWRELWPHILGAAGLLMALTASGHAVMNKRDARSSVGWVGLIWLVPILGSILYFLFGINRIRRKAYRKRGRVSLEEHDLTQYTASNQELLRRLPPNLTHLTRLANTVRHVTARPLLDGNHIEPLIGGDEAYPAMLEAIENAQVSVSLASYIFNSDEVGRQFVDALSRAVQRGVQVRLMIDDIGSRYSFPSIYKIACRAGITTDRFMRQMIPAWFPYFNLRNHRKILVVDGQIGFTGGLNINAGAMEKLAPHHLIKDLHFRLTGPIVNHLQQTFVEDWLFCHGELLEGPAWFPQLASPGKMLARGITYGPDEDLGKMRLTLLGALATAERRVAIVTPYFLPDEALCSALNIAALRGVEVDIILPSKNNLSLVQWASTAMLWQVLEHGCRVWLSPPPFEHTKLMVIDDAWSLFGSGNWDPRSLRLNFEFNVECYNTDLARTLTQLIDQRLSVSKRLTLSDVDSRPTHIRMRDGIARLFTPYL